MASSEVVMSGIGPGDSIRLMLVQVIARGVPAADPGRTRGSTWPERAGVDGFLRPCPRCQPWIRAGSLASPVILRRLNRSIAARPDRRVRLAPAGSWRVRRRRPCRRHASRHARGVCRTMVGSPPASGGPAMRRATLPVRAADHRPSWITVAAPEQPPWVRAPVTTCGQSTAETTIVNIADRLHVASAMFFF